MSKVRVVNPVWNGKGFVKRKVADYYVSEGRAEWVGADQLRLVGSHSKNKEAAQRALAYDRAIFMGDGRTPTVQKRQSADGNKSAIISAFVLAGFDRFVKS